MARTAQNGSHLPIEEYVNAVEQQGGIYSNYPVVIDNTVSATSLDLTNATVALSGITAATLGDTGGATGPATAAQNSWLEINIAGTNYFIPLWK